MAAAFLLMLVVAGAAQAKLPKPCPGGPLSQCGDAATRCLPEQDCRDLWEGSALPDVTEGDAAGADTAEGDLVAPRRGVKCSLCTKIMKRAKKLAGEDADEPAVAAALNKACGRLGKVGSRPCRWLVKKFREKLSQALQNGEQPRDACVAIGICKA